jgi:alpha-ribazole phosphatase
VTTLILIRHGETDWNRDGRWQGHADTSLNDRGREQARALAEELGSEVVAAVYSSDLSRASETAEIIAARLGLPVEVDARLREVDVGGWSGLTMAEIDARFPEEVSRWRAEEPGHAFDGGETYAKMSERVVAAVEEIAGHHPGEQVVVVLHGGPIRALLAYAAGVTYEEQRHRRRRLDNCGYARVAVREGVLTAVD